MTTLITGCSTRPCNTSGPLLIQARGSSAVGKKVQRTPGTFSKNKPTAEGQSFCFPVELTTGCDQYNWRVRLAVARLLVEAINKHGNDVRLVHFAQIGTRRNTHFLMSDLNNVADLVSKFLAEK